MAKYEAMLVYSVKNGIEAANELNAKFNALIEKNGTIISAEPWGSNDGVRDLAYDIKFRKKGMYILYTFECEESFPYELNRKLKIEEDVLRSLVIRL